jgi:hypothetical protein
MNLDACGPQPRPRDTARRRQCALAEGDSARGSFRSRAGFVYVAFILDVFAQRIVAWHASTSKVTDLVMTPAAGVGVSGYSFVVEANPSLAGVVGSPGLWATRAA